MEKKIYCQSCEHFYQHYGISDGRIFALNCGHCTKSRFKRRQAYSKPCEDFKENKTIDNDFTNKRYISRRLVEFFVAHDFLPYIEDEIRELK